MRKKTKVERKFYIAAPGILENEWAHATEAEAIAHATAILDNGSRSGRDYAVISKIVRIVRRRPAPVVVEDVK